MFSRNIQENFILDTIPNSLKEDTIEVEQNVRTIPDGSQTFSLGENWKDEGLVITKKPESIVSGFPGEGALLEITVKNISTNQFILRTIKLVESEGGITFDPINVEVKRNGCEDYCLCVYLPSEPGFYKTKFGLVNELIDKCDETIDIIFEVKSDTVE